ncbi:MAG: hypothetical protein ACR2QH_18425 [Geminicoccaceae bacterium]
MANRCSRAIHMMPAHRQPQPQTRSVIIEEVTPRAQSEVIALANRMFDEGYFRATTTIGNEGIGAKLLRAMLDALVGDGADKLIVTFKRGASAANVDKLMSKLGFEL